MTSKSSAGEGSIPLPASAPPPQKGNDDLTALPGMPRLLIFLGGRAGRGAVSLGPNGTQPPHPQILRAGKGKDRTRARYRESDVIVIWLVNCSRMSKTTVS